MYGMKEKEAPTELNEWKGQVWPGSGESSVLLRGTRRLGMLGMLGPRGPGGAGRAWPNKGGSEWPDEAPSRDGGRGRSPRHPT